MRHHNQPHARAKVSDDQKNVLNPRNRLNYYNKATNISPAAFHGLLALPIRNYDGFGQGLMARTTHGGDVSA